MSLSGFLIFIKELHLFAWHLSHLSYIRLTRICYLDMLAVITQYTMFFDCIEGRRSVSTSNIFAFSID